MKVLLDENLPHDLRHFLPGHEVFTVAYMKWASLKNGELLRAATAGNFEVLITKDSGVEYQQNMNLLPLSVIVIQAKTNKLADILPHMPSVLNALSTLQLKTVIHIV